MKLKSTITFFLLLLACITTHAQESKVITGTIIDPDANFPLFGATVVLLDSSGNSITGVVTDEFGEFTIRTKASGKVTLQASYIGFATRTFGVEIEGEQTNVGNIVMNADAAELDQVVIIGNVEGKSKALNLQRNADNIKTVVSSDLIGRFPDLNVAEALQRVSGVNISRDKGEGSTVSIRGTPLNYTTIQVNGEQIPSVQVAGQSASRSESLDLIPADQLAFMEVTKVPTPDMDGDAIGGTINLQTAVARRFKFGLKAESGFGYNDISDGLNALNRLRIDKRFFKSDVVPEGKLGIILGGSMFNSNNSEHRAGGEWIFSAIEALDEQEFYVLDEYEYQIIDNERSRYGVTNTIDYKFNGNHRIVFNYMYNRRTDDDIRNRIRYGTRLNQSGRFTATLDTVTNGRVRRDILISKELKENSTFNLEGSHTLGSWDIDWKGFYAFSERNFDRDFGDFAREDVTVVANNNQGIYGEEPNLGLIDGVDPNDPLIFTDPRRFERDFVNTEASNLVGRLDITKHLRVFSNTPLTIKFGGKYRTQSNDRTRFDKSFIVNDPNNVIREEEFFIRSISGREPLDYLYGDYRFGPLIGENEFLGVLNNFRNFLVEGDEVSREALIASVNGTYEAEENIYAGYVMGKLQFEKLMILAGVRYENNEVNYNAFEVRKESGQDPQIAPVDGGNDFDFFLPNLQLKYSLSDYTSIRLSGVMNFARANFTDVVPFANQDDDERFLFLGNPDLKPAEAINVDAMFEHYFQDVGVISLGAFYKSIDNFQFERLILRNSTSTDFEGFPGTQGYEFRQQQNGENATVAGLEFNFFRTLGFLPGFFKNFNIEGNYTYTYSDASTFDRDNVSLPGQAEHTFNTALAFDYKGFSARISANYNGSFGTGLGGNEEEDTFQDDRLQIDANASYKLGKHLRFYIEGVNLSNEPTIRYQGDLSRLTRRAYFGWSTRAGVSYTL